MRLLCLLCLLFGCATETQAPTPPGAPGSTPAPASAEGEALTGALGGPVSAAPATEVKAAGCTASPTLQGIPKGAVAGEIDGVPFKAESIVFERTLSGWALQVHDTRLADTGDLVMGGQQVVVRLQSQPRAAWTEARPLELGDGYWVVQQANRSAPSMATRRGAQGWALAIDRWAAVPWEAGGGAVQDAGRADGRLAIVLRGDGGRCSWVAGTFTNAVVRYVGPPHLRRGEAGKGFGRAEADDAPSRAHRQRDRYNKRKLLKQTRDSVRF